MKPDGVLSADLEGEVGKELHDALTQSHLQPPSHPALDH